MTKKWRIAMFWFACWMALCGPSLVYDQVKAQDDGADQTSLRERTIYIPYQRLRSLFEKEGRGVFLPYEEFQQLWEAARQARTAEPDAPELRRHLITSVDSVAQVEGEVVAVESTVRLELLDAGWHEIPLQLMGAALSQATIDNRAARVYQREDGQQVLLVRNPDAAPLGMELNLSYSQVYDKRPGTNQVAFHPPMSPIHRWEIVVPESDAQIRIQPNVALKTLSESRTDAPEGSDDPAVAQPEQSDANSDDAASPDDKMTAAEPTKMTRVEAYVGGTDTVAFTWTAKAEGAAGLAALVTTQSRQEVTVDEGVIRTRATLTYDISRSEVSRFLIEVPADHDVVNVFDPNVQRWEKIAADGLQRIDVRLFQPVKGAQNLVIELEKFTGGREMMVAMVQADIDVPTIQAISAGIDDQLVNIGRQQGVVVVRLAATLRGDVYERSGLAQIDAAQVNQAQDNQAWDFAYRYATVPYSLGIRVERLLPEITASELVTAMLAADRISFTLQSRLAIQRAGVFQLEYLVPANYTIDEVASLSIENYGEVQVESYEVKPGANDSEPSKLIVQLGRQAIGNVAIIISGYRELSDDNLRSPTGSSSSLNVAFARLSPTNLKAATGTLNVIASESLRLSPTSTKGVRTETNPANTNISVPTRNSLVGSFAFGRETVDLAYDVSRRRPFVEARQGLTVDVQSGVVKFASQWNFDVRFSSVPALRVDLPNAIVDLVSNEDGTLVERVIEPQPADVAEGYTAWELKSDDELIGEQSLRLTWEIKLGELPVGEGVSIELPAIKAFGVDRQWGQVVAKKAETIEVGTTGEAIGIRPIDPRNDLMPGLRGDGVARAFEFQGDWLLSLEATRYELEEIKRTSVERGLVRAIMTRSDQMVVQAIFRLRSARQRIAVKLPGVDPSDTASSLDAQPLKVNQRSVALERDSEWFYIPYTGFSADESVLVELKYTIPRTSELMIPEFPEDPAVQVVDLVVYVPEEWAVIGQSSNWSRPRESWPGQYDYADDSSALQQLRAGLSVGQDLGSDFPVDGERHQFTSLKPETGDAGALRLRTVHRLVFDLIVVAIVVAMGVVLAFQTLAVRLLGLASLLVLALGTMIIEPWLATQLLRWPLFATMLVVLGAWSLRGGIWGIDQATKAMGSWSKESAARRLVAERQSADSSSTASSSGAAAGSSASSTGPVQAAEQASTEASLGKGAASPQKEQQEIKFHEAEGNQDSANDDSQRPGTEGQS